MNSKQFRNRYAKRSEHSIQSECVAWWRKTYPARKRLLFAIPNGAVFRGTDRQRKMEGAKLKREGAVPGAADLFLAVPSGDLPGLFIEMKTPTGTQSKTQKAFEADVLEAGYGYAMPRSVDEFKRVVMTYLETGKYDN